MVQGTGDTLARLSARLDAQDRLLAGQETELAGLRAEMACMQGEEITPVSVAGQTVTPAGSVAKVSSPRRTASASRRTLLKGAGAALFTTALLATGEVIPITPFRVAAADPYPRPSRTASPAVTVPDTLYQTFVGTDFQPETTANGYTDAHITFVSAFAAGQVYPSTAPGNFSARVDLPQGATINEILFYVIYNDGNYMAAEMAGYATDGTSNGLAGTVIASISSSVQTVVVPILQPAVATVDTSTYSYVLRWISGSAGPTQQLYGARVGYTLPGSAQVYGGAQAGVGVRGDSATGNGVIGNAPGAGTVAGVLGSTDATLFTDQRAGVAGMSDVATVPALYGHATVGDTNGVTGIGANGGAGVQGNTSVGQGVAGLATGANGLGVYGQASGGGGVGVVGLIPTGSVAGTIAVYGANGATAANSHGVIGLTSSGHGVVGVANGAGPIHYAGIAGLGANGANAGDFYGDVAVTGTLNGHTAIMQQAQVAVAHPDGTYRLANSIGAAESWLEDVGEGTLANGQAEVKIAPDFAAVADTGKYHVFLTAHGDFNLHVAEMKADGFVVRVTSAGGGTQPTGGAPVGVSQVAKVSSVAGTFSWRVMAKRKDGQAQRLAAYTFPHLEAPHIPDSPKRAAPATVPKKP